jgi:hypothetical protein
MHKITLKDIPELDLGDKRRNERLITILDSVIKHPGSSIPKQSKNWYETKATYEFYKNESITLDSIQKAIHSYGATNVLSLDINTVLIPHDTTNISFNDLDAEGLGYLDNKKGRGILLHNSIAVSTTGTPLMLLHQYFWTRDDAKLGKAKDRRDKEFKDKESYKWLKAIEATNDLLGSSIRKVHIGDREADIYDLFFAKPEDNSDLLIRATYRRKTSDSNDLWDDIALLPALAVITLEIPDGTGKKKKQIKAEVRFKKVDILKPTKKKHQYNSVELTAIEVKEVGNTDENRVHWKLLTTLEIKGVDDVKTCIRWYTYRWLIERFHYTLKSGCKIESLQLKQAESLKKAIVIYSLAAFKIMVLVYESREKPDISCTAILLKEEWEALFILINRDKPLPKEPPTLIQAAAWFGRLGGHLGRKSDGPPGLKTVWLGYQRLKDYTEMYLLLRANKFG